MEKCAFDPSGEVLAVAGKKGYVHLVDWKSGAGQVVGSVKMNSNVKGLWWRSASGGNGAELMSLGEDAEVYVWDIGQRRCTNKWKDEGGYGSQVIGGDHAGKYLGIGWVGITLLSFHAIPHHCYVQLSTRPCEHI